MFFSVSHSACRFTAVDCCGSQTQWMTSCHKETIKFQSAGVSIVAGWRVDLPACNGPITRLEPSHERQVRPDNFISALNSCQKIGQNRFYV